MKQVRPKKNLGQHFLTDLSIAKAIADTVDACPDLPVLEVGPGMGVMTQYLVEKPRELKVVEIDRESVAWLNEHFPRLRLILRLPEDTRVERHDRVRADDDVARTGMQRGDLLCLMAGKDLHQLVRRQGGVGALLADGGDDPKGLRAEHLHQLSSPRRARSQNDLHHSTPR